MSTKTESAPIVLGGRSDNYLAKAILLDEAVMPLYVRLTIWLIGLAVVAFIAWAAFAKLDIVATAPGQVVPTGAVQIVQHIDGGRIATIAVAEGDLVKKGQTLVTLNSAEAEADLQTTRARFWALTARVERLKAFAANRAPNFARLFSTP